MAENSTILAFTGAGQKAIALVRLSDNFLEQTGRPLGLEGILRGYDESQENVGMVDIEGEKFPARVHILDFDVIN